MLLLVAMGMIQNLQKYFGKMCLKNGKNNEPQIVASAKNNVMLDPQIPTKQEKGKEGEQGEEGEGKQGKQGEGEKGEGKQGKQGEGKQGEREGEGEGEGKQGEGKQGEGKVMLIKGLIKLHPLMVKNGLQHLD